MFKFLFSPHGRVSRKAYALGYLIPVVLLSWIPGWVLTQENPLIAAVLMLINLFFLWPSLVAIPVKRFHDLGRSGWYHAGVVFIALIFFGYGTVGFILLIIDDPELANAFSNDGKTGFETMLSLWRLMAQQGMSFLIATIIGTIIQYGELLLFLIVPGQRRDNKFGADPLGTDFVVADEGGVV